MKFLIMTIAMFFSLASMAGVLKKSIPQSVLDGVNVGNGAVYIQAYDVKKFDLNNRVNTVKKWNTESGCSSWATDSSVENAILKLHETGAKALANILEDLRVKNQIKAAIYNTASPSYDLENCAFYYYEFYSVDGEMLILDLDFNA